MNLLEKCAEILVEYGHAERLGYDDSYVEPKLYLVMPKKNELLFNFDIDPFSDTLEGRRQADAIEDWLQSSGIENMKLYIRSGAVSGVVRGNQQHQWRLDRIKWCIDELIK